MTKKVYVGMSGGVDSSLSAALLVERGYHVTGVYMKNWTQDLPGMKCPWADDLADAKRVATKLGIDFKVFDFEKEYKDKVVNYMIDEYKAGRTPNPDVMCNQEVKFKLFLEMALEDGAEMIATGHYARTVNCYSVDSENQFVSKEESFDSSKTHTCLEMAVDANKDQTYFLYRVTSEALSKTIFPIGEYTKPQVRQMALERGLSTAQKKDSQGICFVGQVGIKDFLRQYVQQKPGEIIDSRTNKVLGMHEGAIFYTIGQRHGLNVGGGLPYYVSGKDMDKNEVYVTNDINSESLWRKDLKLSNIHWISGEPEPGRYAVRLRHRAPLIEVDLLFEEDGIKLVFNEEQKAVASGQSAVIYDDSICLGGGIVI